MNYYIRDLAFHAEAKIAKSAFMLRYLARVI